MRKTCSMLRPRVTTKRERRRASATSATIAIAVAVCAIALTGCSQSTGIAALDRDAGAADALPGGLPSYSSDWGIDEATVRFVGSEGDIAVYLARGPATSPVCVLLWKNTPEAAQPEPLGEACGGIPVSLTVASGTEVRVASAGTETPRGFTRLDDNVMVHTAP